MQFCRGRILTLTGVSQPLQPQHFQGPKNGRGSLWSVHDAINLTTPDRKSMHHSIILSYELCIIDAGLWGYQSKSLKLNIDRKSMKESSTFLPFFIFCRVSLVFWNGPWVDDMVPAMFGYGEASYYTPVPQLSSKIKENRNHHPPTKCSWDKNYYRMMWNPMFCK